MPHSLTRAVVAAALLFAVVGSGTQVAAQATQAGIAQARIDSLRRPYTAADIEFMSGMIMHHAQAVKMAGWAASHGASKSLQIYCGRVAMAQSAEIGLMKQWLAERNQPVPEIDTASADMAMHMNMPGMQHDAPMKMMPGMLSPAQMHQLDAARGVEFDRMFLTFMIQHHRGALTMVDTLFKTPGAAQDEFVFKFANDVHADQSTEIDRMQQMLDALPPAPGELDLGRP
ncbi:MAG TPA: DUF305 domain-containing protein [Gemmatimonadaceae bacterium]|jgi:uncharacterized protein (DUF305 family)|nr:DUF305 domain-containing protein [Gemmatimonadaceae bacterium]